MSGGGATQSRGDYIRDVVLDQVQQEGMRLTDEAVDYLQSIIDDGLSEDAAAAEDGARTLARTIVAGAGQVGGLHEGDVMDASTLRSIRRWFCPMSPWC
jgi:hypothetical protein